MKKVSIITCHDVYNHGASLQSYALLFYIRNKGYDVTVVNYKPAYLAKDFSYTSVPSKKYRKNFITKILYIVAKIPSKFQANLRARNFDSFSKSYISTTNEIYMNNEDLRKISSMYDIYICGSDQIWNTLFENGKDPAFYLNYVNSNKLKISYAASLATEKIYDNYEEFVKENVSNLDFISVRESSSKNILKSIGVNNDICHVCDPAFLLDSDQWDSIAAKFQKKEKYILVYDFDNSENIRKVAMKIAKERNMKIYSINPGKFSYADKSFKTVGPDMFLALIKNSDYVVTNSYHAVVFSVIYRKEFLVIGRKEAINIRMEDLMYHLNIGDRFLQDSIHINLDVLNDVDYSLLEKLISSSKNFLDNALQYEVVAK